MCTNLNYMIDKSVCITNFWASNAWYSAFDIKVFYSKTIKQHIDLCKCNVEKITFNFNGTPIYNR